MAVNKKEAKAAPAASKVSKNQGTTKTSKTLTAGASAPKTKKGK
ncbi:hypothetical protein [Candidatus Formimonas warabiya]|nr:hypothetical protein [Candidatus Formimonas warabiya]